MLRKKVWRYFGFKYKKKKLKQVGTNKATVSMASTHKAMESTHDPETTSIWTDEKHRHYLNTMEASFVRTMLHHYVVVSPQPLRLDRYLPDTSESTLDSRTKKHAPAGSPTTTHFTSLFLPFLLFYDLPAGNQILTQRLDVHFWYYYSCSLIGLDY